MSRHVLSPLLLLCSCASQPFRVQVDGFASGAVPAEERYAIEPDQTPDDPLAWAELRACIARALAERGWREAAADEARHVLRVSWGISAPEEYEVTHQEPVFGQTGETTTYQTGYTATGYGVTATTTPEYGITHYRTTTTTEVRFQRQLSLRAFALASGGTEPLWETRITSSGSSGDLREVLPVLLAAGTPYLGRSTGKRIDVVLSGEDERVRRIAGLVP